jgi:hypothetical protein
MKQLSWTLQPGDRVLRSKVHHQVQGRKNSQGLKCLATKGLDGTLWFSLFNPFERSIQIELVLGGESVYFEMPAESLLAVKKP